MGPEIFKYKFMSYFDYSRAPGGPIREEHIENSFDLMIQRSDKIQIGEGKIIEA
jgi:hypothetical protein